MSWERFVEGLFLDFKIPDRDQLIEVLEIAYLVYDSEEANDWERRSEAQALDELDGALQKTVKLLRSPLESLLARELAGSEAEMERRLDELREMGDQLAEIGIAVSRVPRRLRRRGEHHARYAAVRALMDVLVDYWTSLGRKFEQDHKTWAKDRNGRLVPTGKSDGLQFAFRIVEHLAPGQGESLRTIAREYTSRSYGK